MNYSRSRAQKILRDLNLKQIFIVKFIVIFGIKPLVMVGGIKRGNK